MHSALKPVLAACFSLILPAPAALADMSNSSIHAANNEFWLAAGGTFLNYKEPFPPPDLSDSERDWLPSFAGGVSMMTNSGFFLAADFDGYAGTATYRGALLATPTVPLVSNTEELTYSLNGRMGWGFSLDDSNSMMLTPYAEFGSRYWRRELSAAQVETYTHYDVLAGLMFQYAPVDSFILSLYGAAGSTFSPEMKYGGNTYDLGETLLWRAGTKLAYNISPRYELFSTLAYQHFRYGRSPVQPDLTYEPSSFTNEMTARVGFGYKFD